MNIISESPKSLSESTTAYLVKDLQSACDSGNVEIVQAIAEIARATNSVAKVLNAKDAAGKTPLAIAALTSRPLITFKPPFGQMKPITTARVCMDILLKEKAEWDVKGDDAHAEFLFKMVARQQKPSFGRPGISTFYPRWMNADFVERVKLVMHFASESYFVDVKSKVETSIPTFPYEVVNLSMQYFKLWCPEALNQLRLNHKGENSSVFNEVATTGCEVGENWTEKDPEVCEEDILGRCELLKVMIDAGADPMTGDNGRSSLEKARGLNVDARIISVLEEASH